MNVVCCSRHLRCPNAEDNYRQKNIYQTKGYNVSYCLVDQFNAKMNLTTLDFAGINI